MTGIPRRPDEAQHPEVYTSNVEVAGQEVIDKDG